MDPDTAQLLLCEPGALGGDAELGQQQQLWETAVVSSEPGGRGTAEVR